MEAQENTTFGEVFNKIPEDWMDREEFAKEVGVGVQYLISTLLTKEWLLGKRTSDNKEVPLPTEYCKKEGGKERGKAYYSPKYVELVKSAYEAWPDKRDKKAGHKPKEKDVKHKLTVHVLDQEVADFIKHKFGDDKEIELFLRTKLNELYAPVKAGLAELNAKFEEEKKKLFEKVK